MVAFSEQSACTHTHTHTKIECRLDDRADSTLFTSLQHAVTEVPAAFLIDLIQLILYHVVINFNSASYRFLAADFHQFNNQLVKLSRSISKGNPSTKGSI